MSDLLASITDRSERENFKEKRSKVFEYTLTNWKDKMPQPLYDSIFAAYEDGIHELEEIIGRSLKELWY